MSPQPDLQRPFMTPLRINDGACFHSFATNNYRLHFLEVPSGLKLILTTAPQFADCQQVLQYIYDSLYVELVMKNPLYTPGLPFQNELFTQGLQKYLRSIPGMLGG
jgi:trafficking protein particle complex subunit 1